MMEAVREYVVGLTAAAMICAITLVFAREGSMGSLLKLICGLVLTFTLVKPVLHLSVGDWESLGIDLHREGEQAVQEGKNQAEKTVRQIIKEETEAYILDKARELGLEVRVEIQLSSQALPVPERVTVWGVLPPWQKGLLSQMLSRELGIRKENQQWRS